MSLSLAIFSLWDGYLAEERAGVRSVALMRLDAFIASLRAQCETDWQNWAIGLAEEIVDHHRDIPVRMPLFRSVIFPALHCRLTAGSGSAARALAGFSQLLYHSPDCSEQLPPQLRSEHGLILEAIRRDASDLRSKRRLRTILRGRFEYSLHEMPAGVLCGHDGATVEQCSEMIEELEQYTSLCAEIGSEDADREIIDEASYCIPAYRDYLTHREAYDSFPNYIEGHNQRKGEQSTTPNSRPAHQLSASPEIQSPDSLRTPSSGGCG